MKKRGILFLTVLFSAVSSIAQTENIGARGSGMGNVVTAIPDFWSADNNQAMLPFYGEMAVSLSYDNRYLLKETSSAAVGFIFPLKNKSDVFGTVLKHYGGENYGKLKYGFSYAKSFAKVFSFGLQFDYLLDYFGDIYGKQSGFTFEMGMYGQITKRFALGFHAYNPARLKMITYNSITEYIPTILSLGFAYKFKEKCIVGMDVVKNLDAKIQCRTGLEYRFSDYLIVRGGLQFPDFSFHAGVGTAYKDLVFDFASSFDPYLGYSPQLTLIYVFKKWQTKQ
jgi:hypothetical protein